MIAAAEAEALIAEATARTVDHARQNPEGSVDLARRLSAALHRSIADPSTPHENVAKRDDAIEELSALVQPIVDRIDPTRLDTHSPSCHLRHIECLAVKIDAIIGRHFECDCVPHLGPSHCHRCGDEAGHPVPWLDAHGEAANRG